MTLHFPRLSAALALILLAAASGPALATSTDLPAAKKHVTHHHTASHKAKPKVTPAAAPAPAPAGTANPAS